MAKPNVRSEGYARRWKDLVRISPGWGDESPARVSLDVVLQDMEVVSHTLSVKRPVAGRVEYELDIGAVVT